MNVIFHNAVNSAGDSLGKGTEPALCTHTDVILIHSCDRWGYFSKLSVYWSIWNVSCLRLPADTITTPILCSCKHLQNEGKVPAESDVQNPAPPLRHAMNSIDLLMHLVEQRWAVCRVHSFWTVESSFLLCLAKDSPKPGGFTRLPRLGRASVRTVWILKTATHFASQVASFTSAAHVAWDLT